MDNLVGKPEHAALQASLEAQLADKLKKIRDDFRPGGDYLKEWGYTTDASGAIPYTP